MATFLELCRDLRRESGIAGTGPSSVTDTNQPAQLERQINWIRDQWEEIQDMYVNWRWMRASFTLSLVAGTAAYSYGDAVDDDLAEPIERFARWWADDFEEPPTIYLTSAGKGGEGYLSFVDWPLFKQIYDRGNPQTGFPAHVTIDPKNRLVFGPTPNDAFTVRGAYQRSPQTLVNDSDEPEMPVRFHKLILWRALEQYALFESAAEVLNRAQLNASRSLSKLEADQLPFNGFADPLA